MRIAYLWQEAGPDFRAEQGLAVSLRAIVSSLQRRGNEVHVFALGQRRQIVKTEDFAHVIALEKGLSASSLFKVFEGGVRRLQTTVQWPYLGLFESVRFGEACARLLGDYDILHVRPFTHSWGPVITQRWLRRPMVFAPEADPLVDMDVMGVSLDNSQRRLVRWAYRAQARSASAVVCLSQSLSDYALAHWHVRPEKAHVLPLAVDVDLFAPKGCRGNVRERLRLGAAPTAIFCGGFYPWHGLDILIEGFRRVVDQLPEARLLLVGDGREKSRLEEAVRDCGLQQQVLFLGRVPHEQVPALLEAADVAVAPYQRSPGAPFWNSPLKLYEYMAAGKAIVASRLGQQEEVIRDGYTGRLVEPSDSASWAQTLMELFQDPASCCEMGQNARKQAAQRHSWEQYGRRLEEIYRSVLAQEKTPEANGH